MGKTEKHTSQVDAAKGFGGKYGVQKDRQDKVRLVITHTHTFVLYDFLHFGMCVHLSVRPSVCVSFLLNLFVCPFFSLDECVCACLCMSVYVFVCMYVCMYLMVCLL